jgi:hypothetical protein
MLQVFNQHFTYNLRRVSNGFEMALQHLTTSLKQAQTYTEYIKSQQQNSADGAEVIPSTCRGMFIDRKRDTIQLHICQLSNSCVADFRARRLDWKPCVVRPNANLLWLPHLTTFTSLSNQNLGKVLRLSGFTS